MSAVSPRPAPRRDDPTALKFLRAGVQLLEAALSDGREPLPPRLRSIKFPAALDWLRIEDVLRVVEADEAEVDGKRALRNRWPSKDEYVRDVVMYSLLYADSGGIAAPGAFGSRLNMLVDGRLFSEQVNEFAVGIVSELVANPRSYLLAHLSPMLTTHPALRQDFLDYTRTDHDLWRDFYEQLVRVFGLTWRPGWNSESFTLALQCLLDGFVLRHRVDEERSPLSDWAAPSFVGATVTAIIVAAIDFEESGRSIGETLDALLAPKFGTVSASPVP
jgi:hypothetical protein